MILLVSLLEAVSSVVKAGENFRSSLVKGLLLILQQLWHVGLLLGIIDVYALSCALSQATIVAVLSRVGQHFRRSNVEKLDWRRTALFLDWRPSTNHPRLCDRRHIGGKLAL